MKKYLAEGFGAFFYVLIFTLTAGSAAAAKTAPFAVGAILTAMIYAGRHISGAHFNPAITLAALMRGRIDRNDAIYYVIAQMVAACLAAIIGGFLIHCANEPVVAIHAHKNIICSVLAEFLGTFALTYVVLQATSARVAAGNTYDGLAIGFVLMALSSGLGGISGGAFNPAVAFGASIAGIFDIGDIWIFAAGELLGAAAATTAFQLVYGNED